MKKIHIIIIAISAFIQINALQALECHFSYDPISGSFEYQADLSQQDEVASCRSHYNPLNASLLKYTNPSYQYMISKVQQNYDHHISTMQQRQFQSLDEFHIDTDFLTEKDIDNFVKKFNHETTVFISELSIFWTDISNKYDKFTNKKKHLIPPSFNQPIVLSREQAIIQLKDIGEKIFDPADNKSLATYLSEMKKLTPYLDENEDTTILESINFLDKHQHRTNMWDYPFWMKYATTVKVENIHPIITNSTINKIPLSSKIQTLKQKSNLTTETVK